MTFNGEVLNPTQPNFLNLFNSMGRIICTIQNSNLLLIHENLSC
jgi:hypothetical protein